MQPNSNKCKGCPVNLFDKDDKCHYCVLKPPIKKIEDENKILENCGLGFIV